MDVETVLLGRVPAYVTVDWDEIFSGHYKGGGRVKQGKKGDMFPDEMSPGDVKAAVEEAYKNSKKIDTQGCRIKLSGTYNGKEIHMWLNTEEKVLETAYPQGWGYVP